MYKELSMDRLVQRQDKCIYKWKLYELIIMTTPLFSIK